jgi:hypothetical protein
MSDAYDSALAQLRRLAAAHPELRGAVRLLWSDFTSVEQLRRDAVAALEQVTDTLKQTTERMKDAEARVLALEAELLANADPTAGAEQVETGGVERLAEMAQDPLLRAGGISVLYLGAGPHPELVLDERHARLVEGRTLRLVGANLPSISGRAPRAKLEVWRGALRGGVQLVESPGASFAVRDGGRVLPVSNVGPGVPQ